MAALIKSILIGRISKANGNFTAIYSKELIRELELPYSIILAGIGMLFAVIGWALSIAMYCKLRKQKIAEHSRFGSDGSHHALAGS